MIIKATLRLIACIGCVLTCFGQPKDKINIPKGGEDIKITEFTNLFSLYITENQEVYNDHKRLMYFEYINYSLRTQRNSIEPWMPLKVLLYADEKVYYKFIDKIKSHIPVTTWLYYMTDNVEDLRAISFRLNSRCKKSLLLEEIPTLEKDTSSIEETIEIIDAPELQLEKDLYFGRKKAVKKTLNSLSNKTLIVSKNKTLLNSIGENIDSEFLERLIKKNRVLFLKFDDAIFYEDYLHTIQKIKKIYNGLDKGEQRAYVIEISYELEKIMKDKKIKL